MDPLSICFVCDAGMGSSALGASILKKQLIGTNVSISNSSINNVQADVDIIILQEQLLTSMKQNKKFKKIYTIDHYLNSQRINRIAKEVKKMLKAMELLSKDAIITHCRSVDSDTAIRDIGKVLLERNCIEEPYISGMLKRDHDITTYIGNEIAIPHGEYEVKKYVKQTGLAVMIYPEGINWHNQLVRIVIGIAAIGDNHMELLSNIALKLSDMDTVKDIVKRQDPSYIHQVLTQ